MIVALSPSLRVAYSIPISVMLLFTLQEHCLDFISLVVLFAIIDIVCGDFVVGAPSVFARYTSEYIE